MAMPETAALLSANPVEYYVFHWGMGSLTHAGSAALLWQPGVNAATLCPASSGAGADNSSTAGEPPAGASISPAPALDGNDTAPLP
jgi:hypothetical protein